MLFELRLKLSVMISWFKLSNIHSFIQTISIAPLQVHFYSEALPTQHGYCVGVSRRSATGKCELRTCPRSVHGGYRAGVEPTTLRLKAIDSTNAPPHTTKSYVLDSPISATYVSLI